MMKKINKTTVTVVTVITAALAAVILYLVISYIFPVFFLPAYSRPASPSRVVCDEKSSVKIEQNDRALTVETKDGVWELPSDVKAQDFLYEDVDHDGEKELMVLCWKRGRFGKHRPTWKERDEIRWSQHIFIYETENGTVRPKWMASDIGMKAASWEFSDGRLSITDTDGNVTSWVWISWGLEKM